MPDVESAASRRWTVIASGLLVLAIAVVVIYAGSTAFRSPLAVVVLDERVTPRMLAEHLFAFARAESCGSCAPCRIGTARLHEMTNAKAVDLDRHSKSPCKLLRFSQ